jgi:hypothetical protein
MFVLVNPNPPAYREYHRSVKVEGLREHTFHKQTFSLQNYIPKM